MVVGPCLAFERHPEPLSGKWVSSGTRMPVADLFESLNEGVTLHEFLDWYKGVERSDAECVVDRQISLLRAVSAS